MQDTALLPIPELDLVTVNKNIAAGLKRVEEVKQQIEVFKEESVAVKISGEDDKDGYLATKEFLSRVRPTRTGLENERKSVVKPFNDLVDVVNSAYKKATAELASIELPHKQEKEEYEAAEERRKAEELLSKEKVINDKIALLLQNGLEYNPLNGCYTNTSGRAVTRMDITNMPSEDFERLVTLVKSDYEKTQAEILEQKRLEKQQRDRKIELTLLQIPQNLAGFQITDESTGETVDISMDDLNSDKYESTKNQMVSILAGNTAYYQKIKDNAAAAEKQRIENEQALADRERKIKDQEEKLLRMQIAGFKTKLSAFKFIEASLSLDESQFQYLKSDGTRITLSVSDLMDDESLIESANEEVAEDVNIKQEAEAKRQVELNSAIEKQKEEKRIADEAAQKSKLDAEAKQKRLKNKDIAQIDPCVSEIFSQVAQIKKMKFEVIGEYANKFIQSLETAIENYNNDLRHLR